MVIHVIGTINGQINEGMRNIATHISRELEEDNIVLYSRLKQLHLIVANSLKSDTTLIFARANKMLYWLTKLVTKFCKNVWIVLVQKPDMDFMALNNKKTLKCSYLSITKKDLEGIKILPGKKKCLFPVGIKKEKFSPVNAQRQSELKEKYGFNPQKPLIVHVGHCSAGRGLEDFTKIKNVQTLIVASGMFENEEVIKRLQEEKINIYRGYIDNIEEIYQMADIYLFPTRSAEFVISIPLSVMEALSCGVPVIGYENFVNLNEIACINGSIILVQNADEIEKVIPEAMVKKKNQSLLTKTFSWKESAQIILEILKEESA